MWAHRTNFWRLRLNFFRQKTETHSLKLRTWPKHFSKKFFPGIAIGHLWFSFDEPAENMLTNGRKRMGSVSEQDSKNCFFSRIKVFFLRKCPWTCILQFDNSARKSPIKYQKFLDQGPKVTIKIFPTKFSSKRNWTFWMQFWQIHARKFQKWQTQGPMFEINKKNIFSQKKSSSANCFHGHAQCIFDNTPEIFSTEDGAVFTEVQKHWKKNSFFQNKKHSSPNCASGRLECHFEECAKTFCDERPKFFAHCTKRKKVSDDQFSQKVPLESQKAVLTAVTKNFRQKTGILSLNVKNDRKTKTRNFQTKNFFKLFPWSRWTQFGHFAENCLH